MGVVGELRRHPEWLHDRHRLPRLVVQPVATSSRPVVVQGALHLRMAPTVLASYRMFTEPCASHACASGAHHGATEWSPVCCCVGMMTSFSLRRCRSKILAATPRRMNTVPAGILIAGRRAIRHFLWVHASTMTTGRRPKRPHPLHQDRLAVQTARNLRALGSP